MNNDAQIDYWNGKAGEKWVEHSNRLDGMLAPFADAVLEAASIQPGERALDIGCGAGALTLAATAKSGGTAGSMGVDVSEPLLALARQRAADAGSPAVFEHADASAVSIADKLDLMISRFGVMFFEDPSAAFANIRGQIKPGGRLTFMCWQTLQVNDWAFAPLQAALPLLEELPAPPDPTAPGPFAFADKDRVASVLRNAGWSDISVDPFNTHITLPGDTVETSAKFMLQIGPLARLIAEQNLDAKRVEQALTERLSGEVQDDGRVAMRSACWLVQAEA